MKIIRNNKVNSEIKVRNNKVNRKLVSHYYFSFASFILHYLFIILFSSTITQNNKININI